MESLAVMLLACLFSGGETSKGFAACLPVDVGLEEVASAPGITSERVTVRQALLRLEAHCKGGKLIAGSGREIRFYRLVGCWGNPPADYLEQLARQSQELQRLKKDYSVVEIACAQVDQRQIP